MCLSSPARRRTAIGASPTRLGTGAAHVPDGPIVLRSASWYLLMNMRIEGKRVLVTGGAGFIGSHLVERLARDNDVTVLDDFSVGSLENLGEVPRQVPVLRGEIRDAPTVADAVARPQIVFHLA